MSPSDIDPCDALERFRRYRATRDRALRNELVEEYASLARTCARRFAHRSEPLDDLQQVALLGLLKAVERFDPDRGVPFVAFAMPTVLGELRRHFRDHGWMVRVPRRLQELHFGMESLIASLEQELQRSPTIAELADAAGVAEEDILEAREIGQCYRPPSLDTRASGVDPGAYLGGTDKRLLSIDDRTTLSTLLERLPNRERQVLYMRFFEERTQSEIAAEIGVSQMHVSRILSQSLAALAAVDHAAPE